MSTDEGMNRADEARRLDEEEMAKVSGGTAMSWDSYLEEWWRKKYSSANTYLNFEEYLKDNLRDPNIFTARDTWIGDGRPGDRTYICYDDGSIEIIRR